MSIPNARSHGDPDAAPFRLTETGGRLELRTTTTDPAAAGELVAYAEPHTRGWRVCFRRPPVTREVLTRGHAAAVLVRHGQDLARVMAGEDTPPAVTFRRSPRRRGGAR